jgi:hypothetical protein
MFLQSCRRLRYLSQKLIQDLKSGEKIFVYKFPFGEAKEGEIMRLHSALRRYGNARLLCVRKSNQFHSAGSVELVSPSLMVAYMERFAEPLPNGRLDVPYEPWANVCREANRLWEKVLSTDHRPGDIASAE